MERSLGITCANAYEFGPLVNTKKAKHKQGTETVLCFAFFVLSINPTCSPYINQQRCCQQKTQFALITNNKCPGRFADYCSFSLDKRLSSVGTRQYLNDCRTYLFATIIKFRFSPLKKHEEARNITEINRILVLKEQRNNIT